MATALGSFAESGHPLLSPNKANIKSSCVLEGTDAGDPVEAAGLSRAQRDAVDSVLTSSELKLFAAFPGSFTKQDRLPQGLKAA